VVPSGVFDSDIFSHLLCVCVCVCVCVSVCLCARSINFKPNDT